MATNYGQPPQKSYKTIMPSKADTIYKGSLSKYMHDSLVAKCCVGVDVFLFPAQSQQRQSTHNVQDGKWVSGVCFAHKDGVGSQ